MFIDPDSTLLILLVGPCSLPENDRNLPEEVFRDTARRTLMHAARPIIETIRRCEPGWIWLVPGGKGSLSLAECVCNNCARYFCNILVPQGKDSYKLLKHVSDAWKSHLCDRCEHVFECPNDADACRLTFGRIVRTIQDTMPEILFEPKIDRFMVDVTFAGTDEIRCGAMKAAREAGIWRLEDGSSEDDDYPAGASGMHVPESVAVRRARWYFQNGLFSKAQRILEPYRHSPTDPSYDFVSLCRHWRNRDYAAALSHAKENFMLMCHLGRCCDCKRGGRYDVAILRDILDWGDYAMSVEGDEQRAGDLLFKALEYAAKMKLWAMTGVEEDENGAFPVKAFKILKMPDQKLAELDPRGMEQVTLTVKDIMDVFKECGMFPKVQGVPEIAEAARVYEFYSRLGLDDLRQARNDMVHRDRPYTGKGVKRHRKALEGFLVEILKSRWETQPSMLSEVGLLPNGHSAW